MLHVAISGASGFIGKRLSAHFKQAGHSVVALSRRPQAVQAGQPVERETHISRLWDPLAGKFPSAELEGLDVFIHLAGENIAARRWNAQRKVELFKSRCQGTLFVAQKLAQLKKKPKLLLSASGVGFYGDRGAESLTESSSGGKGFLAELAKAWEAALDPAREAGIRCVTLRFGMVLGENGGALSEMLPVFRACLGGRLGPGRQYLSWIAIDDVITALDFVINHQELSGALNLCSPNPVTNKEFTQTLSRVLNRPALLPVPALLLKIIMGEMAKALLLSSIRALPAKLEAAGFKFSYPDLQSCLTHVLAKC